VEPLLFDRVWLLRNDSLSSATPSDLADRSGAPNHARPSMAVPIRHSAKRAAEARKGSGLRSSAAFDSSRFVSRYINPVCGVLSDLVPQRPNRHSEQACRRCAISIGVDERFQNQIPLDLSNGRADQPASKATARCTGNWSLGRKASHVRFSIPTVPPNARLQRTTIRLTLY
jgi:hypothetical protein